MTYKSTDQRTLNKEQQQAVEFGDGPLLIIAGAGTGKTTVVTERIKHIISSGRATASEVLALTFTEKAAREMEERVDQIMPYGYTNMWISTFHKFCDRILRQEAIHVGLNPTYKLMTDTDATMLIRQHLFDFDLEYFRPLGNPTKFIGGILQHISRLQDEDVSPEQYIEWVRTQNKELNVQKEEEKLEIQKYEELAKAYKAYQGLKVKEGLMDFGDLITQTLHLFRTRKNLLSYYQKQFRYMLVDEYQDTNIAQNELVALLAGEKQNITAVCDDDQCLPSNTQVETPSGRVAIKDIRPNDVVITAVGKGYLSTSVVTHVRKDKKKTRFIMLTMTSGATLEATDNHRLFCHVPGRKFGDTHYYVYLMQRKNLGWRLGVTRDLAQRLRLERSADRIIAVRSCESEDEARFYEAVYALRFGIPTYPFKPRKRMVLTGKWLIKLFEEIDSEEGAKHLASALGIDLTAHHFALGGVARGDSERVKVMLRMCIRRHRTKWAKGRILTNPTISHEVALETSSVDTIRRLRDAAIPLTKAKKGWKIRRRFADLTEASGFARKITILVDGLFEAKFDVAKRGSYARQALIMPAGNVFPGMYVPVLKRNDVVYEQVVTRTESIRTETVYDLEIDRTHNFIANGVVVHNSIYKFRGAAVSNVLSFRKHFKKAHLIVLSKNYRSTQSILDSSYDLIQHNNPDRLEVRENINKKLVSERKIAGERPKLLYMDRVENEADEVAKTIKNLQMANDKSTNVGYLWKDFAILVRANNHAEPFVRALLRHHIPYQFLGPGQLFRQPEVKDLISYLHVIDTIDDNAAFFRVLSMPYFAILPRDVAALSNFAKKQNLSFFEAAEVIAGTRAMKGIELPYLLDETKKTVTRIIVMLHTHFGLVTKETAGQILFYFLQDTGIMKSIMENKAPFDESKITNISKFFSKLKTYETDHKDASVRAILDWITLSSELGESPLAGDTDWVKNDAVNILTIHGAKGLEFPVVFLVNLVGARFPSIERREQIPIPDSLIKEELPEGDYHLEEERRLFYVGMTRAKDQLYLTAANFYGEGKREKKLSPFVGEALGVHEFIASKTTETQISLLDWKSDDKKSASFKGKDMTDEKSEMLPVTYLSYSQIEAFAVCPLHYKLRYLLHIPTPATASLSFGTSIHNALRDFYGRHSKKEIVSKKLLLQLLSFYWLHAGYESKDHEEQMKKQGERYLSEYFDTQYVKKTVIGALELPFVLPIGNSERQIKIGGKIDRVDILPDGKIEIIDYKTGKMPAKKEIDANLQLSMYALAASEIQGSPFGKNAEDIILTMYYFDTKTSISTIRSREQLDSEKVKILSIASQIEASDFVCSGTQLCRRCEYSIFCG